MNNLLKALIESGIILWLLSVLIETCMKIYLLNPDFKNRAVKRYEASNSLIQKDSQPCI
jgi:hypothetical protein